LHRLIEVLCGAAATGQQQTVIWQNATWLVRRRYVAIAAEIADANTSNPDLFRGAHDRCFSVAERLPDDFGENRGDIVESRGLIPEAVSLTIMHFRIG
jgi:hypothetical protein